MKDNKLKLKIYIKSSRKPLCTVYVDDPEILTQIYHDLIDNKLMLLGQVLINADEFKYATIE